MHVRNSPSAMMKSPAGFTARVTYHVCGKNNRGLACVVKTVEGSFSWAVTCRDKSGVWLNKGVTIAMGVGFAMHVRMSPSATMKSPAGFAVRVTYHVAACVVKTIGGSFSQDVTGRASGLIRESRPPWGSG